MLKPPSQNVPGMTDTLEFVKNLWGGMGVPGMSASGASSLGAPALSVDELDKRITDLKAVESWLNLNLTMLRTSIQALEVQRGTLATLKSMSESMVQAMGQKGDQTAALPPFAAFFNAAGNQQAGTPPSAGAQAGGAGAAGPASADAMMPAAVAWWNLLQDQFQQAVASAMPVDGGTSGKSAGAKGAKADTGVPDPAAAGSGNRAGGDTGGTPGTQKTSRTKSDKA